MTCVDDLELGDYVDGALGPDRRADVERHLAACSTCRALVADLQAIRLTARTLEPMEPPPYVWTRISARLEPPSPSWHWASLFGWQRLGTAVTAVTLVVSLAWLGGRLATVAGPASDSGGPAREVLAAAMPWELEAAEAPLATAISGLERIAQEQRDSLDPDVAAVLLANLTVLDDAIGQSREALVAEPESELVQASLVEALRQKVALLEDTVALINVSSVREQRE
jgi:anti-sigma factor RsiW